MMAIVLSISSASVLSTAEKRNNSHFLSTDCTDVSAFVAENCYVA